MLFGLGRLAIGGVGLARLRATARPVDESGRVEFAAARLDVAGRRRVGLAMHEGVASPVALGGWSPLILVPPSWDAWPPGDRRACLLHELAHLARRDDAWKLVAELIRAPFWFHPGVAWLAIRLDREAELAADEAAVARGVAPVELARLLLACARQPYRLDPRALAFSNPATVTTRINRLLEPDMPRAPLPPAPLRRLALVVPLLALAGAIGGARVGTVAAQAPPAATISFTLQPPAAAPPGPAALTVVVQDEGGKPIAGATVVRGSYLDKADRQVVATAADGVARFDRRLGDGDVVISSRPGYSFDSTMAMMMTNPAEATLTLRRPRERVGIVVDAGGQPVAGAEVWVGTAFNGRDHFFLQSNSARIVRGTPIEGAIITRTDPAGRFRFDALPDGAKVELVAAAAGHGTTDADTFALQAGGVGPAGELTPIKLLPEARIEGRVVTRLPGVAVGGLTVGVQGQGEGPIDATATTDAEGRFVVGGLTKGRAYVCVVDLPPSSPWTYLPAMNLPLAPGVPATAEVELIAGSEAAGSVRDADGKPLAGVKVWAYQQMPTDRKGSAVGSPPLRTVTDAEGRYRYRCRPGDVTIQMESSAGRPPRSIHRSLTVVDGQPTAEVEPVVIDTGVLLAGRLVDAAGVPLGGAVVKLASSGGFSTISVTVTDSDGNETTSVPSPPPAVPTTDAQGRFSVRNDNIDGQPVPADKAVLFEVKLADGRKFEVAAVPNRAGPEATIKIPALGTGNPAGPTQVIPDEVAGRVVDAAGRPLAGAAVVAEEYGTPAREVATDAAGGFSLRGFRWAPTTVRFGREGFAPLVIRQPPLGRTGWVVVLDDRAAFEGRVLAPDGSPLAGVPIRAEGGAKMLNGPEQADHFDGRSGPDGRYRLHLTPGMYEFQVRAPGVGALRLGRQVLGTDEARTLDLPLSPPITFQARVVDAGDGSPVAGFTLGNADYPAITGTSDAAGLIRIADMLPGRFVFGANRAEDQGRWWSPDASDAWFRLPKGDKLLNNSGYLGFDVRAGMEPVTIRAERAATFRGRVVDPDGNPRGGATVLLGATRSGDQVLSPDRYQARADAAGMFAIRLPASGDDAYRLAAHDGPPKVNGTWTDGAGPFLQTRPGSVVDDVVLRLTRPATLQGRVLDVQGRPVADEEVQVMNQTGPFAYEVAGRTRTGADGTFTITGLTPGPHPVSIEPFGLEPGPGYGNTVAVVTLADGETKGGLVLTPRSRGGKPAPRLDGAGVGFGAVEVVPEPVAPAPAPAPPQASIGATVRDADGRPIEGATVLLRRRQGERSNEHQTLAETRTDAAGAARFDRRAEAGDWLLAYKEGYCFVMHFPEPPAVLATAEIQLPSARAVAGTVVDSEGKPIVGAEVWIKMTGRRAGNQRTVSAIRFGIAGTALAGTERVRTDAAGHFRSGMLPDDPEVQLEVAAPGMGTIVVDAQAVPSPPGGPVPILTGITLAREARLRGRVVSRVTGLPVGGRAVVVETVDGAGWSNRSSIDLASATTDADGRFEFGQLVGAEAGVNLSLPPGDRPWTFRPATHIPIRPGQTSEATVELIEGVVVTGTMVRADGRPVAGVEVNARFGGTFRSRFIADTSKTDADGVYRFRLPPGPATFGLDAFNGPYTWARVADATRQVEIPEGVATFALPPVVVIPTTKVAGRVVDAAGRPVGGAKVEVAFPGATSLISAHHQVETDAEGRFVATKLADNRTIPDEPGHLVVVRLADGRSFDVGAVPPQGGAETTVRLPVQIAGGPPGPAEVAADEIAGVVVDARGRPIVGAAVGSVASFRPREGVTDERGHFRFRSGRGETGDCRISKAGYAPVDLFRYPLGRPGLVVVLDDRTFFEGRVLGPDGKPAADVAIQADSGPQNMTGASLPACITTGRSGPDGRYRLAVAPGVYEVQVRAPGVGVLRLADRAIAPDEARALDLQLAPGVEFRARVVDAGDGKPVAGFQLTGPPDAPVQAVSDAAGTIRIADLMPGPFLFQPNRTSEEYRRWWSDACLTEFTRYRKEGIRNGFRRNFDGLDFDMQPGMAPVTIQVERGVAVRGVVLDPDGKPVAGATVAPALTGSGNSLTGDTRFSVPTAADGTFAVVLPASGEVEYNLVAHDGKYRETRTWANGVGDPGRTVPGQVIEGVTLRLTRPATVRGRVVDEAGRPVAAREVSAAGTDMRDNRYYNPTTRSAADGTFVLPAVRPGELFINVQFRVVPGQAYLPGSSAKVTLEPGEAKEGVTLTVPSTP